MTAVSLIRWLRSWRNFPSLYRVARKGCAAGKGRRAAIGAALHIGYGIRMKRFWRLGALATFLRARPTTTPDRSRRWVVRMWWRYV